MASETELRSLPRVYVCNPSCAELLLSCLLVKTCHRVFLPPINLEYVLSRHFQLVPTRHLWLLLTSPTTSQLPPLSGQLAIKMFSSFQPRGGRPESLPILYTLAVLATC
jgi:hypothetical protein